MAAKQLKLNPSPTFPLKVLVPVPGDDAPTEVMLVAKYRNIDELMAFSTVMAEKDFPEVIADIVVGWEGVDAEFSGEALAILQKNYPGLHNVILAAYFQESQKARAKN